MPRFDPADWGGDPIPLSKPRDYNPAAEVSRLLVLASAQQIDQAVLAALQRRGLSLADAIPRLTRQDQGLRCTVLLDGQPLVELDPPEVKRSAGGRHISVTITCREAVEDWTLGDYANGETGCPNCGRMRLCVCPNGKHRCEKCDWSPELNGYVPFNG